MSKEQQIRQADTRNNWAYRRRRVLGIGGAVLSSLIAGCSQPDEESSDPTHSASESEIVEQITFEGQNLVVHLTDGHGVSEVNLIAPDGSLFTQEPVERGVSTVRLKIMDVSPDLGNYEHYTPGEHEIQLIMDDSTEKVPIQLSPSIQVKKVHQFQPEEQRQRTGQISILAENTGTAPTWIYDMSFSNSPNYAADGDLGDDPGIISVENTTTEDLIVFPDKSQTYVSRTAPLLFEGSQEFSCDIDPIDFSLHIGIATKESITKKLRAKPSGQSIKIGHSSIFSCTDIEVQLIPSGSE